MDYLIYFVMSATTLGIVLWVSGKLTSVDLPFDTAVIVAGASALAGIVPKIGLLLSLGVSLFLLNKLTDAPLWPKIISLVVVSNLLTFLIVVLVIGAIFL